MIEALPDFRIDARKPIGSTLCASNVQTYREAAGRIWHLPYGRNSDRADFLAVLAERRGTCSTKHALLAALARENGQPVRLALGIYLMTEANTPGVGAALARHGLRAVPEAHCYLRIGVQRVDITRPEAVSPELEFLTEELIEPEQIGAYKIQCHWAFLTSWAQERNLAAERVWLAREACIAALGSGPDGSANDAHP